MSLRLYVRRINENRSIMLGTVKEVKPGVGASAGKVVNVVLEGSVWNRDEEKEEIKTVDIAFWNNDTVDMADRVMKAKVREGSVLTVDVYEKDGKYTGNRFKYNGHWKIAETDENREMNIFMGVVASMHEYTLEDGRSYVRISMPDENYGSEETEWVTITLWNNEKSNVADRAKKVLGEREGKKARAVVICGQEGEYNGRKQYTGFDFILL